MIDRAKLGLVAAKMQDLASELADLGRETPEQSLLRHHMVFLVETTDAVTIALRRLHLSMHL